MSIGVVRYGAYLPYLRIRAEEYKKAWGACAAAMTQKVVPDCDEDSITMMVEAAREALEGTGLEANDVAFVGTASTSLPYAEKASGGSISEALGLRSDVFTSEHTTSTASGLEALMAAISFLQAGVMNGENTKALVVAGDVPQSEAPSTIEHGLGAAAAAFMLGGHKVAAEFEGGSCMVRESLGDRYRVAGGKTISDLGVPEYSRAISVGLCQEATRRLLGSLGRTADDYNYLVVGDHDGRLPMALGRRLGFADTKIKRGLLYPETGDTGAASALLSLALVLDEAQDGDKILLVGHGSGAKAIAMSLRMTQNLAEARPARGLRYWLGRGRYLDYVQYLKVRRQII